MTKRICSIEGCGKGGRVTQGFCAMHYKRLLRHGDPLAGRTPNGAAVEFIEQAILAPRTNDCIIYPYPKKKTGYGKVTFRGKRLPAHRLALILSKGNPPDDGKDYLACHAPGVCHNPACVNPAHLRWGTASDNMEDRKIDGTSNRGERCGASKLTNEMVSEIYLSDIAGYVIADRFGVNRNTVYDIRNRRTWEWLTKDLP